MTKLHTHRINATHEQLVIVIEALEYKAYTEAGQTQAPDLCVPSDYEEWDFAQTLRKQYGVKDD